MPLHTCLYLFNTTSSKGAVHWYCLQALTRTLTSCFITQVYKNNLRTALSVSLCGLLYFTKWVACDCEYADLPLEILNTVLVHQAGLGDIDNGQIPSPQTNTDFPSMKDRINHDICEHIL